MIPLRYRVEFAILNAVGAAAWAVLRFAVFPPFRRSTKNHGSRGLQFAKGVVAPRTRLVPRRLANMIHARQQFGCVLVEMNRHNSNRSGADIRKQWVPESDLTN
jgi:hypothetical protein